MCLAELSMKKYINLGPDFPIKTLFPCSPVTTTLKFLPTDSVSLSELREEYLESCRAVAGTCPLPVLLHVLVEEVLATDSRLLLSCIIPFSCAFIKSRCLARRSRRLRSVSVSKHAMLVYRQEKTKIKTYTGGTLSFPA